MTDRDIENAKKLLAGSQVFAHSSRDGFIAQYSVLNQISPGDWDSLLVVAGTGTALLMIPARYTLPEQKEMTAAVVAALNEWEDNSVQSLANFINFVTTEAKSSANVPDTIGHWILRDVELRETDHSASRVIGTMLLNTFGPWWDQ